MLPHPPDDRLGIVGLGSLDRPVGPITGALVLVVALEETGKDALVDCVDNVNLAVETLGDRDRGLEHLFGELGPIDGRKDPFEH